MNAFDHRISEAKQHQLLAWYNMLKSTTTKHKKTQIAECLYPIGIALEETLWFVFNEAKQESDFITYINNHADFNIIVNTQHEPLPFSKHDIEEFNQNGVIVLKNAVDIELAIEAQNAIYTFLQATDDDPDSWYKNHEYKKGLMLVYTKHPAFIEIRKSARIKKAFEQLYGSDNIYASIDKVSFNPPITPAYKFMGSGLHWDVSLTLPIPYKLQGLIYLNDVAENSGAFNCVPGFHQHITEWINTVPANENIRNYALQVLTNQLKPITGNTGDMVIWNQALPHCATPNKGQKPRLVKYLTYIPFNLKEQEIWL